MVCLMLLPAFALVLGTFLAGTAISLIQSLDYLPFIGHTQLSLQAYRDILGSTVILHGLVFSLAVALVATIISAMIAMLLAHLLRPYTNQGGWLYFLLQFNIPIPHVVGAVAIGMLFSQSGLLARLAAAAGMIQQPSQFPVLINDQYGAGIIMEYIWKEVPFIAITLLSILKSWVVPYEQQLQLLGAGRWQRWRMVTLPFMLPPLISSCMIVFAYTFGSFEVPYILGSVSQPTLPLLAYEAYLHPDLQRRPEAMAINMVITLISMILIAIYMKWGETHAARRS